MSSKKVSALKFVGTVSVGLLTVWHPLQNRRSLPDAFQCTSSARKRQS